MLQMLPDLLQVLLLLLKSTIEMYINETYEKIDSFCSEYCLRPFSKDHFSLCASEFSFLVVPAIMPL